MKSVFKDAANDRTVKKTLTEGELAGLHECLIRMLGEIAEACAKNDIHPFLIYGNLLGKIRHDGFIPWDDDVDIGMTRADYDKFAEIFDRELGDRYVASTPNGRHKAYYRFIQAGRKGTRRIKGADSVRDEEKPTDHCFIDIMPFDYAPDSPIRRKVKGIRCELLMMIAGCVAFHYDDRIAAVFKRSLKGRIELAGRIALKKVFGFRSADRWYRSIDRAIRYRESDHLVCALGKDYYLGAVYRKEDILPLQETELLGVKVYMPRNPDAVLTRDYGDYRRLPPEDKRQCHSADRIEIDPGIFRA